jgi:IS5 family transposase
MSVTLVTRRPSPFTFRSIPGFTMAFQSFFDLENRLEDIDRMGDPLAALDPLIEWEKFRPLLGRIHDKERKSNAGRKPYDVVLMLKILILQSLYNLSDNRTEFMIRDRLSFSRFLKLDLGDRVPDENTIWDFRELLKKHDLLDKLFTKFDTMLCEKGFAAKKGQILDASITGAPKQRNSREENKQIKAGEGDSLWSEICIKSVKKTPTPVGRRRTARAISATRITSASITSTS